jgi:hypothetical protein
MQMQQLTPKLLICSWCLIMTLLQKPKVVGLAPCKMSSNISTNNTIQKKLIQPKEPWNQLKPNFETIKKQQNKHMKMKKYNSPQRALTMSCNKWNVGGWSHMNGWPPNLTWHAHKTSLEKKGANKAWSHTNNRTTNFRRPHTKQIT